MPPLAVRCTLALALSGCMAPLYDAPPPPSLPPGSPQPPFPPAPPSPPSPPAEVCRSTTLASQVPLDVTGTTVGATASIDASSCSATGPAVKYDWRAPAAGVYHFSATGSFALSLDVHEGTCAGYERSCGSSFDLQLQSGENVTIEIAGEAGLSGTFDLQITREPDSCGDRVCELGEDATSCPADCATTTGSGSGSGSTSTPMCGDGFCSIDESSATCPLDCTSTTGDTGTVSGSTGTTTPDDGSDDGTTWPDDGSDDTGTVNDPDDSGDGTTTSPDDGTTYPDDGSDDTTYPDDGGDDTTYPDDGSDDTTSPDDGTGDDGSDDPCADDSCDYRILHHVAAAPTGATLTTRHR